MAPISRFRSLGQPTLQPRDFHRAPEGPNSGEGPLQLQVAMCCSTSVNPRPAHSREAAASLSLLKVLRGRQRGHFHLRNSNGNSDITVFTQASALTPHSQSADISVLGSPSRPIQRLSLLPFLMEHQELSAPQACTSSSVHHSCYQYHAAFS